MSSEIEKTTDLQKLLEEGILDIRVELSLREVLGIAKEFHDSIIDLGKRKWLSTEQEPEKPVEVGAILLDEMAVEDEFSDNHYMKPHWANATTETLVRISDVKESVVALIDHRSENKLDVSELLQEG